MFCNISQINLNRFMFVTKSERHGTFGLTVIRLSERRVRPARISMRLIAKVSRALYARCGQSSLRDDFGL